MWTNRYLGVDEVEALLVDVRQHGWDGVAGASLLREAERVVEPIVQNVARKHRISTEAIMTSALVVAWQALARYDAAKSPDPWGWIAFAARRAAVDAAIMTGTAYSARNRARAAAALNAARLRLVEELGREPSARELIDALTPWARQLAEHCGATKDPLTFIRIAAPMLTFDDAVLDRAVGVMVEAATRPCPRLAAVASLVAAETGLDADRLVAAAELAADLAADLIPTDGPAVVHRRVVDQLLQAPAPLRLPRAVARRLVDELLADADTGGASGVA